MRSRQPSAHLVYFEKRIRADEGLAEVVQLRELPGVDEGVQAWRRLEGAHLACSDSSSGGEDTDRVLPHACRVRLWRGGAIFAERPSELGADRSRSVGGGCREVEGDVRDHVLLAADHLALTDLDEDRPGVQAVAAGGRLGVAQEAIIFSSAIVSSSPSIARSVCGIARLASAMMNASFASVFTSPR